MKLKRGSKRVIMSQDTRIKNRKKSNRKNDNKKKKKC